MPKPSPKTPAYELPAPREEEELPAEDVSRHFPLERYWEIAKDPDYSFDELDLTNDVCKKVILSEIRKVPDLWCNRKNQVSMSNWPVVAVAAFKRTGVLLSVNSMKSIYKCAKDNLRNRLRFAVAKKRLSPKQTEEYLWGWDYYPFIRYYRKYLVKWEASLLQETTTSDGKKQSNEEDYEPTADVDGKEKSNDEDYEPTAKRKKTTQKEGEDPESVENSFENKEDEDIVWLDSEEANLSMKHRILEVKPEPEDGLEEEEPKPVVQNDEYQVDNTYYPPGTLFMTKDGRMTYDPVPRTTGRLQRDEEVKPEILTQQYTEEMKPGIKPVVPVKREMSPEISVIFSNVPSTSEISSAVSELRNDMKSISSLAFRVVKANPDKVKVLRRALYETLFAFEDGQFTSTEDLYKRLLEKKKS